jgi:hypothetical protein
VGFLDLTGELLGKVDFEKSKIIVPQKLVFVCGGQSSSNPAKPTSMREILLARAYAAGKEGEFGGAKVLLAEVAAKAFSETSFNDLLELEKYIAAVSLSVILIVESPGSMCELGAFIMVPEISRKLIVVLPGQYKNSPSFITDGAVKYFKKHQNDAQVHGYEWHVDSATRIVDSPGYAVESMLKEIPAAMQAVHTVHAREKFNLNRLEHRIYLVLGFCHLLRAAKLIDIKRCFDFSRIKIEEGEIRHCLETLEICGLVRTLPQGRLEYYIATVEKSPIQMRFVSGTGARDRSQSRWQTRVKDEIDKEEKFRNEMFVRHRIA